MDTIGIIGAGVMGAGVAQSFAQKGLKVILIDIDNRALHKAEEDLRMNIRFHTLFNKCSTGKERLEDIIARIELTTDYYRLSQVDCVVENVTEQWEIKRNVYLQIDKICPPHCIFLVNTSCISITKIAALTKRADKVIGTHFMNPVPLKEAIEIIRGHHTSEETLQETVRLMSELGKECIIVNDLPGFVSNRISHLFMNEAAFVVQDQLASPIEVDKLFRKCYGHKMGPLETADLIGLDTVVHSLHVLYESFQDTKFRCCPLLQKMVDAGLLGKKSGKGFYQY
ncbi:3-hydroxybutyryl-CoA dehydrogenase [Paenibacillus dendritiformis]|nr:3-hydroxybutyryl-CoA dehydrogenase [Paenibacillus dendritiformis]